MMYQSIRSHKRVYDIYSEKLIVEGVISQKVKEDLWKEETERISNAYTSSRSSDFDANKWKKEFFYNKYPVEKRENKNTSIS